MGCNSNRGALACRQAYWLYRSYILVVCDQTPASQTYLGWRPLMFKRAVFVALVLTACVHPSLANIPARGDQGQKPWVVNLDRLTLKNRS